MDLGSIVEQWQKILALPIFAVLLKILQRLDPLRLLRRFNAFRHGVSERELLLAMIDSKQDECNRLQALADAEKASGLRWKALWDICQTDLAAADSLNVELRMRLVTRDDSGAGGT